MELNELNELHELNELNGYLLTRAPAHELVSRGSNLQTVVLQTYTIFKPHFRSMSTLSLRFLS